ncbi:MAG: SpoIVB peptidase [Firmicutes bacterium]|nr:SpoIVB peptidase [Bacillota bacterium]
MRIKMKRLSPWIGKSLLIFLSLLVILSPFIFVQIAIPSTVRVMDGNSWGNKWLQLDVKENEWVTVNDTAIEQNSKIESTEIVQTAGVIKLWGIIPLKAVSLEVWPDKVLQAGGSMVGIDLFTDGILVLGTGKVVTESGEENSPARGILYAGDKIRKVNGEEVSTVEEVDALIEGSSGETVRLEIDRDGENKTVEVTPKMDSDGKPRIGIWIRDRAQGLGTLTFVDPQTQVFGAVGHGISDVDTKELLPIHNGILSKAKVRHLVKGEVGSPGEVEGSLTGEICGKITRNTEHGIYGIAVDGVATQGEYPIALKNQVENGKAVILCDIIGETVEAYEVKVEKASGIPTFNNGMVVTVTDERLLDATGGIIQGMSGSPVIQNGRIVGAVTHVFVKDPTKGYGVYIEDMLEAAG